MTRVCALLVATLLVAGAHAGGMYKWVDDDGVTHFSQSPPAKRRGAEERLDGPKRLSKGRDPAAAPTTRYEGEVHLYEGWQDCDTDLCRRVRRHDPGCATTYCSKAKRYSGECASVVCQAKKIAFEKDLEEWLARQP